MMKWIIFTMFLVLLLAGCANTMEDCTEGVTCNAIKESEYKLEKNPNAIVVDKLEIYHFHGNDQCYSCKTVGAYAEEAVKTNFKEELDSGRIVFDHINAELPENRNLAIKYGATGSSLWLGVYDHEGFHPEENTNVWYKIKDKDDYIAYLTELVEKRLAGDNS